MAAELAATSPGGVDADLIFPDFQVELLKVEKSIENGLSLASPIDSRNQQKQWQDPLDDRVADGDSKSGSRGIADGEVSNDGCSTSSSALTQEIILRELWQGGVRLVIEAPISRVWKIASERCGVPRWMPMIEECEEIYPGEPDSGIGSLRRILGDILPRIDNIQSWAIEKLVEFDDENHYYTYVVESSNIGLEGYKATFQLNDFGDNTTLVIWMYEVLAMEDSSQEGMEDYMGMFYKACIRRLEAVAKEDGKIAKK